MNRGFPILLAALLCVSGCSGTQKAAVKSEPSPPPGYAAEAEKPVVIPQSKLEPQNPEPVNSVPLPEYLLKQNRYSQSIAAFKHENFASETPPDPEQKFRYLRLAKLMERIGLSEVPSREAELRKGSPAAKLANKSIKAFLEERDRHAVLYAAAAQGTDPDNSVYSQILQALEAWTGRAVEAGERQEPKQVASYKLRRATALFNAKRFEDGAEQCLEALLLNPRDASIHERLGSMYYAMGARDLAIDSWRESLRLNPGNGPLKDFMARLESDGPKTRTP